jgi:hypothetical protein
MCCNASSPFYCKLPYYIETGWLSEPAIPALSQEVNAHRHCNGNTTGTPNINAKHKFYKKCHKFILQSPDVPVPNISAYKHKKQFWATGSCPDTTITCRGNMLPWENRCKTGTTGKTWENLWSDLHDCCACIISVTCNKTATFVSVR